MPRVFVTFTIIFACLRSLFAAADQPIITSSTTTFTPDYQQFDANRIRNLFSNVGEITSYRITGNAGLEWPSGTSLTAVFQSGLWIAGKVNGEIRTALSEYASEFQPGKILPDGTADDPTLPKYKVYSIYRGDQTSADYLNWPVEDGAPIDAEGKPLLLGDQTHWFVCNDLSAETHANLMNTTPIGLEAQFTIFGADHYQGIQDIMFVKILLINKSSNVLDSTYVGIWSDPDLGSAADDYVGCDTTYQLSYCYNQQEFDQSYHSRIPSVGFQFIQGPLVPTPDSFGYLGGKSHPDYSNFKMTNFYRCLKNATTFYDPENAVEVYNIMKGLDPDGRLIIDPTTNKPSPFCVPGDPLTGSGWYEDIYPGDRRFLFASGPFTFAPGDTQEVIVAVMVGESSDRLGGIATLRKMVPWINYLYQNNFQALRLPLNLVHSENLCTESADNYLYLQIDPDDSHCVDLANSAIYYRVDSLGDFAAIPLQHDRDNQYFGLITLDGNEHLLEYYFSIKENEGQTFYLPVAAPTVFYSIITGQDRTPPVVTANINRSLQSVFISGEKSIKNSLSILDRFAPDTIFLEYRINNGSWTAVQPDYCKQTDRYYRPDIFFRGDYYLETRIAWQNVNFGDQIEYRYVVLDSAVQRNRAISTSGFIQITHQQTWKDLPSFYGDWQVNGWYVGYGTNAIFAKCDSIKNYRNNLETSLAYSIPVPLNRYQNFSIVYEEVVKVAANDTCYFEINPDGLSWQTVYFHTNYLPTTTAQKKVVIPLENLSSSDNILFRFRFKSGEHTGDLSGWLITNIYFYADTVTFDHLTSTIIQDFGLVNPDYPATYANWNLNGWEFNTIPPNYIILGISADSTADYIDNLNTTLTYNQPLDFSGYFLAYLRLYGLHWINVGDTGFVELSPDGNLWTPIKYLTGDTSTTLPTRFWYEDIAIPVSYLSGSYYLRFRFQTDANSENNQYGWWIYRLFLATSTRVTVNPQIRSFPEIFSLAQNFPNPFNPVTTLRYQLPEKAEVTISVYNLAGQLVTTLVREQKPAGTYSVKWHAANRPSGIYFIALRAGNFHQTRKCLLLK